MLKAKYTAIILLLLFFGLSISGFSQEEEEFNMEEEMEEQEMEKEIDPLIKMWYIRGNGAFIDSTKLDTLHDYFHLYHPVFRNTLTASYVGNYGGAYLNNDFFARESNMDFLFLKSREAYLLTPVNIQYYNTRTPYTRLDFSQSENKNRKSETRFNVIHTQNVNPYLNFTFRFDQAKSQGQYQNQEGKNNFVTLYSNYNKDELKIHAGFIGNLIQNEENGGIKYDSLLLSDFDTDRLEVNLTESKSHFNSTYFFANGEYRFGKYIETTEGDTNVFKPILGLLYSFDYQRHKQEFTDEEDDNNVYFQNSYFNDLGIPYIKDSIRFNKLRNIIQLKQYENPERKTSFGKRVFLGQEFIKASSPAKNYTTVFVPNELQESGVDTVDYIPSVIRKFSNVYVGGGIFRETGNFWTWDFDGKIYLLGRNVGQTEINGRISKPFSIFNDSLASLTIKGSLENLVADIFQEEFYSNHIMWKNDLKMEQRMVVGGSFNSPKRKFEIGANYAIINNFIYNNTLGIPSQTNKELLVVSAYLDKDFNYKKWHFRTRLLWQKASNEEFIHLPDFSTFISAYQQFVILKVLQTQLGVDLRYNTTYYADAYSPSTGLFYLQNEKKMGNYPYLDAYASVRLKRTRLFFKMQNLGTSFLDDEYFTTPHFPMNRMTFRLGVSWAFYD